MNSRRDSPHTYMNIIVSVNNTFYIYNNFKFFSISVNGSLNFHYCFLVH